MSESRKNSAVDLTPVASGNAASEEAAGFNTSMLKKAQVRSCVMYALYIFGYIMCLF